MATGMNETLYKWLASCENAIESGDGIRMRCPYCGGSASDTASFSIRPNDDGAVFYKCFRASCGRQGILDIETMQRLGCTDLDLLSIVANMRNITRTDTITGKLKIRHSRNYKIPNVMDRGYIYDKYDYIKARLGDIPFEQLEDFKIVLNITEFINLNGIPLTSIDKFDLPDFNRTRIGFLSLYGDYLNCRDIRPGISKEYRYINLRLGPKEKTNKKMYVVPSSIDLISPEPATINVAEGVFSILGAMRYEDKMGENNVIWAANCGMDYSKTILHLCKTYGLLDVSIHIWSDSEIKPEKYKQVKQFISRKVRSREFVIHYNTSGEDFGYPFHQITGLKITLT